MATLETQILDDVIVKTRRKMLSFGGAALAGLAVSGLSNADAQTTTPSDNDILNFALNLEYLEAQFYNLAVYGVTIDKLPTPISISSGSTAGGTVTLKPSFAAVPFTNTTIKNYATETAREEANHVSFLQSAISSNSGTYVAMPNIDLYNSFNGLAAAAGIGSVFDPFASDANFLIGAYIFEDVGVSAYHGAAPLISNKTTILPAAVGIHAVEAYHAGLVRLSISQLDAASSTPGALLTLTQQISAARQMLGNTTGTAVNDLGITNTSVALERSSSSYAVTTIVNDDLTTGAAPGRSTAQVIQIVTAGSSTNQGGFFPNGLNGNIH